MEAYFSNLHFRTTLAGVLLGLIATIYFVVGQAGFLANPILNFSVAAALGAVLIFFGEFFISVWRKTNWVGRILWITILLILIFETLLSCVPPTARDELTHHLAIPKLYANAGRIREVPIALYAYFPMLLDMLYTPWVLWRLDFVPKIVHGLYGYLTGMLIFAYVSRHMNSTYGLLGFFFFISTPTVLRLLHWAYVDLGVTFYTTAALLSLLEWREVKDRHSWLVLTALSAGFAAATKPNGFLAAGILSAMFLFCAGGEPTRARGKMFTEIFLFGILAALPVLPWLVKNWQQTGNPFFPLLASYFPQATYAGAGVPTFVSLGVIIKRELVYGESWWQIAALPLRLFLFGKDDNPQYFDGALSPALILFLPWAFKGKWLDEKKLLFGFAALFLAFAVVLVDLRARYILPIVPPLAMLLAYGVFNLYLGVKQPCYLIAVLIACAVFNGSYLWSYFRDVAPWPYIVGRESRVNFLTRTVPEFPVFEYVNRELPEGAKIYLIFIGRRSYYCDRDYFHDAGELPGFLLTTLRSAQNSSEVGQALARARLTHLMAQIDLLTRYLRENLTPQQAAIWNDFVAQELHLVFQDRGYAVFHLQRRPP